MAAAPRQPRGDPFGARLRRGGPALEQRGKAALPGRLRAHAAGTRHRHGTEALALLLGPQALQLLPLLGAQLAKLCASEMPLLLARLPLLRAQVADLLLLLSAKLAQLPAIECARRFCLSSRLPRLR